jgi:hypothetical protein
LKDFLLSNKTTTSLPQLRGEEDSCCLFLLLVKFDVNWMTEPGFVSLHQESDMVVTRLESSSGYEGGLRRTSKNKQDRIKKRPTQQDRQ